MFKYIRTDVDTLLEGRLTVFLRPRRIDTLWADYAHAVSRSWLSEKEPELWELSGLAPVEIQKLRPPLDEAVTKQALQAAQNALVGYYRLTNGEVAARICTHELRVCPTLDHARREIERRIKAL